MVIQWSLTPVITFMFLTPLTKCFVIQRDAGKLHDNSMDSFWQFVCFHGCLHRYQTNPDVCSQLHNKDKLNLCAGLRCMNRLKYRLLFTNPCSHNMNTEQLQLAAHVTNHTWQEHEPWDIFALHHV